MSQGYQSLLDQVELTSIAGPTGLSESKKNHPLRVVWKHVVNMDYNSSITRNF